jgi:hypothetical protein
MHLRLAALALLAHMISYVIVASETVLDSTINENVTLRLQFSPFIANTDVIISRRANLTIEPGCELRFAKGKQLIVNGILEARGTSSNPIVFTNMNENTKPNTEIYSNSQLRLVDGETISEGSLQIYYNSKWHYVCGTQFK